MVHVGAVFITFVEIFQLNWMKRNFLIALVTAFIVISYSCEDVETYADMKKKEAACIEDFIRNEDIVEIDFETFKANGYVTDTAKNEFVLFKDKGIYMQIVRKGEGRMMDDGERLGVVARYVECNIETGDTISGNLYEDNKELVDFFYVTRTGDSFSASFTRGHMYSIYGSSAVPNGWLVPFSYITPGRPNDKAAKVRLILPHSESTSIAAQYVYPTYYEITYIPEPNT